MNKSIDVFAATNPAFLSLVLLSFIEGYNEEAEEGLPFALAILPIPIILSGDLDTTFDGTNIRTGFYSWVKQNPGIVVNLNSRINESIEYIQPAISYGVARKTIKIDNKGRLWGLQQNTANFYTSATLGKFFKNSKRLGNWIGQIKSTKTVFNHLGLEV